eukprot:5895866-Alexandrium_andersonii.AAC.1
MHQCFRQACSSSDQEPAHRQAPNKVSAHRTSMSVGLGWRTPVYFRGQSATWPPFGWTWVANIRLLPGSECHLASRSGDKGLLPNL